MNAQRKKAEALIYKFFDALDPTKANSNFYKEMFAKMSDQQFMEFCKRKLPLDYRQLHLKENLIQINVLKLLKQLMYLY